MIYYMHINLSIEVIIMKEPSTPWNQGHGMICCCYIHAEGEES